MAKFFNFKHTRHFAILCGLVACTAPSSKNMSVEQKAQIWLAANTKIGAAIGIDRGDGSPRVFVSGMREFGEENPIQMSDKFHLGSITKSMTSALTMRLSDQGKIDVNMPVSSYFSEDIDPYWNKISLADLMSHRSGLDANIAYNKLISAHEERRPTVDQRASYAKEWLSVPAPNPKGDYLYSNVGYMLLGHILEKQMGQPFEELMTKQLFKPLSLRSAGFGAPLGDAPLGHSKKSLFGGIMPHPTNTGQITDNPSIMSSAGRAHMTTNDLLAFGRAILDSCFSENGYLQKSTCAQMFSSDEVVQAGAAYGYGWLISKSASGAPIYSHDGSNTLWFASIALIPEQNAVVVVATNDGRALERQSKAFTNLIMDVAE